MGVVALWRMKATYTEKRTMTDIDGIAESPTRQSIAAQNRSLPGRVTGKLYKAIEAMVWEGASRKDAAKAACLSDHGLRQALRRPHVLAHYRAECEVLRTSGRAKELHRLEQLAEQDESRNAAVAAIKAAEQIGDEAASGPRGVGSSPGVVIRIVNIAATPAARQLVTIDALPRDGGNNTVPAEGE